MLSSRMYTGPDDYELLRQVIAESLPGRWPNHPMSVGDLDWWAKEDTTPADLLRIRIWFADQRPIGWVWPNDEGADMIHHPDFAAIQAEQISWAAQLPQVGDVLPKLFCYQRDGERAATLAQHGYTRREPYLAHRFRLLHDLPPPTVLPPGYTVRNLRGPEEVEARVAAHRDAFAPSKMTVAKHLRVMASPTYRQDLDLLVEAPDGSIAAFALTWFDARNRVGCFEPVGCHSAHRRQGLTSVVLHEGMRRVKALGGSGITVFCDPDPTNPAPRLYQSVGLQIADVMDSWVRKS